MNFCQPVACFLEHFADYAFVRRLTGFQPPPYAVPQSPVRRLPAVQHEHLIRASEETKGKTQFRDRIHSRFIVGESEPLFNGKANENLFRPI